MGASGDTTDAVLTGEGRGPTRHGPLATALGMLGCWALEMFLGCGNAALNTTQGRAPDEMSAPWLAATTTLSGVLTACVVWYVVCLRQGRGLRDGLGLGAVPWRATALGAALGLGGAGLGTWLITNWSTGESMMAELTQTWAGLVSVSIMAVIVGPIEELYYRGLWFPGYSRGVAQAFGQRDVRAVGEAPAPLDWSSARTRAEALVAFGVVLWFGALHIPQLWGDPIGIPMIFVMGASWTLLRWRTGSLWPSLVSHLLYNGALCAISLATWEG